MSISIEELQERAIVDAQILFGDGNSGATAVLFVADKEDPTLSVLHIVAIAGNDSNELRACLAGAIEIFQPHTAMVLFEAYAAVFEPGDKVMRASQAPHRKDVVIILIDHPEGFLRGQIDVFPGKVPRVGSEVEWIRDGAGVQVMGTFTRLIDRSGVDPSKKPHAEFAREQ